MQLGVNHEGYYGSNASQAVTTRASDSSSRLGDRGDRGEALDGQLGHRGGAHERKETKLSLALATLLKMPERPRSLRRPPFAWKLAPEHEREFMISGASSEVVTKVEDFHAEDWVVPVGSTLRLTKGGFYRWTLCIERVSPHRPQLQLGVHGAGHRRPWRLFTTSRCSRARDDEPWLSRPRGDRAIEEGSFVHIEVDLRVLHLPFGTMSLAVNGEPPEVVFDDIPVSANTFIMPVVSMGGKGCRVRVCPSC